LYAEIKNRLNVLQKRMPRREFGREEVEKGKKSVNKSRVSNTYSLHNITRAIK